MAVRTTPIWLADIREEIAGISSVTAGQNANDFAASWVTKRPVEHALLIIAEAAKHVPADMKQEPA
jgi:uncharacterized protein with HEPN domain